ncbi:MAG: BadF/BadG/BcrA/BcrD ATPase family protein, partial [Oscillospiraceae bacterium]
MSCSDYLIAVDGGGTKTEFCFYEIPTGEKSYFKSGSTNYKTAGDRITENNLVKAMLYFMDNNNIKKTQIKGIVVGIAGCDNDSDKNYYQELLRKTGIDDRYIYICNDAHLAFGSSGGSHGIVVIAGTGTICLGIKQNG